MMKLPDFKPDNIDHKPGFVPRTAIQWNKALGEAILSWFTTLDYPYRHYVSIPYPDPLRSEIRRFLLSLDAYIESPNPVIPHKNILYGATEYNYADTLKKCKRKSFETTWKVEHFEFPSWWDEIPSYQINDIGDIFNYSYLIFWKMEDPDDYLNGFSKVIINNDTLSEFKNSLRNILPVRESFNKIEETEVLSQISSSMSIEYGKLKHLPHYMIKNKHLFFAKNIGCCERVILQVSPNNCRDSVLVNAASLNTISLIDLQIMDILRVMSGHIHLRDKSEVTRRLFKLAKHRFFLQRDLRKEGITKPRELLRAMLEVLKEEYPDIPIFRNSSFYDDFSISNNGEIIFPQRGHGLGMANSLTTLMQLAVHEMIVNRLQDDIPDLRAKSLILNDDFVVGLDDEYHVDQYWDMEDEVMNGLSLIRAPEKSFMSERRFVLAERYIHFDFEYEKVSYQLRECLLPLACTNIVHAKEYFRSVQTYVKSTRAMAYIDEICNFWGYEFYPREFEYPYIVGGWKNERINSIDLSLVELDELDFKPSIVKGFYASKVKSRRKHGGDIYTPPIMTLYGNPSIPEEYWDYFDILPMSQINDKYGRILSKSGNEFNHYWDSLYKDRKKAFNKCPMTTFEGLTRLILDEYSNVQFYPSKMMISHYDEFDIIQKRVRDIYLDPNPKVALISYYNKISYEFKETFSIAFTNPDSFTKKTSSLYSKEVERSLKSEISEILFTGIFDEVYIPRNESIEEMYLNPIKIGAVASMLDWGKGIPILKPQYYHPLIDRKRQVYGCLFSIKDQILISDSKLSRTNIKSMADHLKEDPSLTVESILDFIYDEIDKEYEEEMLRLKDEESDSDISVYEEEYIPPRDSENKIVVSINDLYKSPDLLWTINTNQNDYVFADKLTRDAIGDMIVVLTIRNMTVPIGVIDISDNIARLSSDYGMKVSLIVKSLGILEDAKPFDIFSEGDGSDDPYGQLWEED